MCSVMRLFITSTTVGLEKSQYAEPFDSCNAAYNVLEMQEIAVVLWLACLRSDCVSRLYRRVKLF